MKAAEWCMIGTDTAVDWYSYFRDVAARIAAMDFVQIGGSRDVVEVDETHLCKEKYNLERRTLWKNI